MIKSTVKIRTYIELLFFVFCFLIVYPTYAKDPITVGKGIWINIWNYPANPDMYCEYLKSKEIDAIYLQVSRSNMPAIKDPTGLNKIIKAAHSRNIKVIGWSYVFLKDPILDAKKFIQAILHKTTDGDTLDGIAADIEEVTNSSSIEKFTSIVRQAVGFDYPLIAITFSPMQRRADPRYYSWKTIAKNFDIIAPMTYWHGFVKLRNEKGAYDYTAQTITKLKEYTQKEDLRIHLIGDGQKTSSEEIIGFLRAASDHKVDAGVSLYPFYVPKEHQIEVLSSFKI